MAKILKILGVFITLVVFVVVVLYWDFTKFCASSVPIFAYHRVENADDMYTMPVKDFAEQMAYLQEAGYTTMNLDQYAIARQKGESFHNKIVLIFDDGYLDNLTNAAPIMKKHGFTGSMFMAVKFEGWPGYIDWQREHELVKFGWEIGSHTINHNPLTDLKPEQVKDELIRSYKYVRGIYNPPTGSTLSYPSGKVNDAIAKQVEEAGYIAAVSGVVGVNDNTVPLMQLRRVNVFHYKNQSMKKFKRALVKAQVASWALSHGVDIVKWVEKR